MELRSKVFIFNLAYSFSVQNSLVITFNLNINKKVIVSYFKCNYFN